MRENIVAGNWKMNLNAQEANELTKILVNSTQNLGNTPKVILCTPNVFIPQTVSQTQNSAIKVGGQNCSRFDKGAYTGETSASMLKSVGAEYVIIGHSERREYFNESNIQLLGKIKQAQTNNLKVILCCGEPLQERSSGNHIHFVTNQLEDLFNQLNKEEIEKLIVAYEPIWAIGTGETASPEQAQEMHAVIRMLLAKYLGEGGASEISILYGGSVKGNNAKEIFSNPDIDGGLVGGASLNANDFLAIINAF